MAGGARDRAVTCAIGIADPWNTATAASIAGSPHGPSAAPTCRDPKATSSRPSAANVWPTHGKIATRPVRDTSHPVTIEPTPTITVNGSINRPISPGEAPSIARRWIGSNVASLTSRAPEQAAMALARHMAGCRRSLSGNNGCAARRSCRSSRTRQSADTPRPPAAPGIVAGPRCRTCSNTSSSGTTVPANSTRPGQSKRPRPPLPALAGRHSASSRASAPRGRLIRNTDGQPRNWVSTPPATGPKVEDATITAARTPWARPSWRRGTFSPKRAWDSTMRPPPPKPCSTRAAVSDRMPCAKAHSTEAATNRTSAASRSRRRPRASPNLP